MLQSLRCAPDIILLVLLLCIPARFRASDVLCYLRQNYEQRRRAAASPADPSARSSSAFEFDLVICDPPTLFTTRAPAAATAEAGQLEAELLPRNQARTLSGGMASTFKQARVAYHARAAIGGSESIQCGVPQASMTTPSWRAGRPRRSGVVAGWCACRLPRTHRSVLRPGMRVIACEGVDRLFTHLLAACLCSQQTPANSRAPFVAAFSGV
jgi:hypothetical protein